MPRHWQEVAHLLVLKQIDLNLNTHLINPSFDIVIAPLDEPQKLKSVLMSNSTPAQLFWCWIEDFKV